MSSTVKFKECGYGCGMILYWVNDPHAHNGKGYYAEKDTNNKQHFCPTWKKQGGGTTNTNTSTTPQQKLATPPSTDVTQGLLPRENSPVSEQMLLHISKQLSSIAGLLIKMNDYAATEALYTKKISTQLENMNENEDFIQKRMRSKKEAIDALMHEDEKNDDIYDEIGDVDDSTGMSESRDN